MRLRLNPGALTTRFPHMGRMACRRKAFTSTLMSSSGTAPAGRVGLIVIIFVALFSSGLAAQKSSIDLPRVAGCLTQKDARVGFSESYSGPEGLRIRYLEGVQDPNGSNSGNVFFVVYNDREGRAAYYEVSSDASGVKGLLILRTAGSLRKTGRRWLLEDALGGEATRAWAQATVDRVSKTRLIVIPASGVKTPAESCWWNPNMKIKR